MDDNKGMTTLTAAEAAKKLSSFPTFSSGSTAIDSLLGGGYKVGRVVEIFGKSNSGKTQLAMQAALSAARAGSRALFIDTEGTFRPERLEGIANARGWDKTGLLDKIVYLRADSYAEQMETVVGMNRREVTAPCRLVVVDTFTRNFTLELPGSSNLANRQAALNLTLGEMARDAFLSGRAYVLTNRVTFGAVHEIGIGGKTVEQLVHASIRLDRERDRVRATMTSSGANVLAAMGETGVD
jgi:DNA repair protein RadA